MAVQMIIGPILWGTHTHNNKSLSSRLATKWAKKTLSNHACAALTRCTEEATNLLCHKCSRGYTQQQPLSTICHSMRLARSKNAPVSLSRGAHGEAKIRAKHTLSNRPPFLARNRKKPLNKTPITRAPTALLSISYATRTDDPLECAAQKRRRFP